jgi:hypothetical protein
MLAGLSTTAISGRKAIKALCKREGKRFWRGGSDFQLPN